MSTASRRRVVVSMASPGDVPGERAVFHELLPRLGKQLGVELVPTGYEGIPASVGPRPYNQPC